MPSQAEIKPKTTEQEAIIRGLMRKETRKVVLLYSAGADSTAAGLKLVEEGYTVKPLTIEYGQSSAAAEIHLAQAHAEELGFQEPIILELAKVMLFLSDSALLGGDAKDDDSAWVPARNTLFMILAGAFAQQIDADAIAIGFMAEDQGVFGDSNLEHHNLVSALLSKSLSRQMEVLTPLQAMTKREVLEYLLAHGALEYTTSCWNAKVGQDGEIQVCHECANCVEREKNLLAIRDAIQDQLQDVADNSDLNYL